MTARLNFGSRPPSPVPDSNRWPLAAGLHPYRRTVPRRRVRRPLRTTSRRNKPPDLPPCLCYRWRSTSRRSTRSVFSTERSSADTGSGRATRRPPSSGRRQPRLEHDRGPGAGGWSRRRCAGLPDKPLRGSGNGLGLRTWRPLSTVTSTMHEMRRVACRPGLGRSGAVAGPAASRWRARQRSALRLCRVEADLLRGCSLFVRAGALDGAARLPLPPGLLARLRAGGGSRDGRATDEAVRAALSRARASGLASPFERVGSSRPPIQSIRRRGPGRPSGCFVSHPDSENVNLNGLLARAVARTRCPTTTLKRRKPTDAA